MFWDCHDFFYCLSSAILMFERLKTGWLIFSSSSSSLFCYYSFFNFIIKNITMTDNIDRITRYIAS